MEGFVNVTEQPSGYDHLEKMSTVQLLTNINKEDKTIADAVEKAIPSIAPLVEAVVDKLVSGGRLFYIGAGTSGRLGVLDASEIPPTFGMDKGIIIGIIAGGETALRNAVENAEDDEEQGWKDLQENNVSEKDIVIGIASSGRTPYVLGALQKCGENGIRTGCIVCNPDSPISIFAEFIVQVIVGPEFVTGSTRMKSGTAQKLVLNMISTSVMVRLGRVEGNRMVNMQLTNAKLVERGTRMIMEQANINDPEIAKALLLKYRSVKKAVESTYH